MVNIDQYCVHFIAGCIFHWSSCGPLFVFVINLWLLIFLNHSYPLCFHLDYVPRAQLVDCRVGPPPDIWHIYIYLVALRVQLVKWTWCRELGRNSYSEVALLKAHSLGGRGVYWLTWYTHTIGSASGSRDFARFGPGGSTLSRFPCKTPIGKVGTSEYTVVTRKLA